MTWHPEEEKWTGKEKIPRWRKRKGTLWVKEHFLELHDGFERFQATECKILDLPSLCIIGA